MFFYIFICYVSSGLLLKGMVESSLPQKDEPLTPNSGGVTVVRIWCLLAQNKPDNAKIRLEIDPKLTTKWLV